MKNWFNNKLSIELEAIYKNKKFPSGGDLIIDPLYANKVICEVSSSACIKMELIDCKDCFHCHTVRINADKIFVSPCFRDFQMYLILSKLGKYAAFYWSKKRGSLFFAPVKTVFEPPDSFFAEIRDKVSESLSFHNFRVITPEFLSRRVPICYSGPIEGEDTNPTVLKLLFSEELH